MGLLLSKLWKKLTNTEEVKIVIVGLDNAGKTTEIIYKNIRFLVWDLGGQDSLRATWKTYYVKTKAVIMVIDSTDKNRLHISRKELHTMMEDENLVNSVLLVYANKQDMQGSLSAAQISEALNLTSLRDKQWHIQIV
ncbi:10103_t:CDS:2 [Entrophospora sp. SA101]|nr:11095_t:CDS:2 [Entrophospora candida]CAJ0882204.1 10103_t:CDS:2 [Entrophospora sp. SA101]CAJ0908948.1 19734_t:CDS:2 [Entrophospora sp. SA101]